MSPLKEISSKDRKNIFPHIYAPGISNKRLKKTIQFAAFSEDKLQGILYDPEQKPRFFLYGEQYLPTLHLIREMNSSMFPEVHVDQGAISHVLNGADIFSQGVTSVIGQFEKNSIVIILNPQKHVLAVGETLCSSEELMAAKGKSILNLHYLGDKIWNGEI